MKGLPLKVNLPFEIPNEDRFPFLSTLEGKYQEAIWLEEHENYIREIYEELEDHLQIIQDNLRIAESDLEANSESILEYLSEDDEFEFKSKISINEYTDEEVVTKNIELAGLPQERAIKRINELIDEYQDILRNPSVLIPEYFWKAEIWEGYYHSTEEELLGRLEYFSDYQEIVDRFHIFYGRDPENARVRETHLANWREAQELAKEGDSTKLLELQKLNTEAEIALSEGKRITTQDGDCYVCGKFIPHFGGELIIWNEIPKAYFYEQLGGKYQKWRVRHFSGECSQDKYGKRVQLVHIKGHTGYRNERADKCWLCDVDVPVDSGWLVLVDQIPKWKHSSRAFPGAKLKKYYVQCEKVDA